jgi:dihydrolipoamide dehydrogenase
VADEQQYDIAVLGGGPGGYATALRAVGHGLSVAMVEEREVGGTCLHRGCIPSKALLHAGTVADHIRHGPDLGFDVTLGSLELPKLHEFRDGVVNRQYRGLVGLLKSRGVVTINGRGAIAEPGVLTITSPDDGPSQVRASHIVIATGSEAATLGSVPVDGEHVLLSDHALALESIPTRGVVIGGGAVGVEFASLWRSLGAEVLLVEALDRLLPLEDPDSSKTLQRALKKRGIDVRTGAKVGGVTATPAGLRVDIDGTETDADTVLVAIGRRPRSAGIGLDALGLLDERGFVKVDAHGRTSHEGIWAVGDVIPTLALAHAAYSEGFVVADSIAGLDPVAVDHVNVPRVTFSDPQVASVGLTEPEARALHGDGVTTTSDTLGGNARMVIDGSTGLVKVVHGPDGQVLGIHLVGPGVTELIGEASVITSWDAYVDEVAAITHAHPTLSEGIREAMLSASGRPFHTHGG